MKSYVKRLYRLLTARYLVSARWNGVQVHSAKSFSEAMEWVACYPQVPVTVLKRDGLLSFKMHAQLAEVCYEF